MKSLGGMVDMPSSLMCSDPKHVIDYLGLEQEPCPRPPFNNYLGINLIEKRLPSDKAYLLDKNGKVLQVYTIPQPSRNGGITRN